MPRKNPRPQAKKWREKARKKAERKKPAGRRFLAAPGPNLALALIAAGAVRNTD